MQTPATGECGELCRGLLIASFAGLLGTINIAVVVAVCVVLWYRKLNQVTVLALVSDGIASTLRAVFVFMNPLLWNTPSFDTTGVLWIAAVPFSVSSFILVARYVDESSSQTLGEASATYAHRTRWRKRLLFQASIPIVFVIIHVTASLDVAGKAVLYAKYLSSVVLWFIPSILLVLHVVNIRRVSRALRLSRSRPVAMAFLRRFITYVTFFAFGIVVVIVSGAMAVTPFYLSPLGFSVTTFLMSFILSVMAVSNVVMIRKCALLPLEVEQEVHPFAVAGRVSTTLANQGKLSGSVVDRTKSVSANDVLAKRVEKRSDRGSILTVAFEDESFLDPGSRTETPTTGWMPRNLKRQSSESPPLFGSPEVQPKKGALQASVNTDIRGRILLCEDQNVVANIIIGALKYYRPNVVRAKIEHI
jgi:cytochrome c-type biogenesis protein CcmH/NrfF